MSFMMSLEIKIKKLHPDAVTPTYAMFGDAGMDLYAVDFYWDEHNNLVCHTGLSMEIPEGYVGLIFPRSSISKTSHHLRNSVGVIDSGYRGEIIIKFGGDNHPTNYTVGDRVAQIIIMPFPEVRFVETLELSESERDDGAFGSTGSV